MKQGLQMYRKLSILLAGLMFVLPVVTSAKESPFNVDAFFGWDGCYRPMEWTPVEIGISTNLTEPFAGGVSVSSQQDGLNKLNVSHTFVITPDLPVYLPLVSKFAYAADSCTVTLSNERDRTVWYNNFDLWDYSQENRVLTALSEKDMLIGLIGPRKFGLFQLSEETASKAKKEFGKVYVKDKIAKMTPWDWTGFVSLDLLILYDPDYSVMRPQQLNAISQWVSNGGRLLVILGSNPLTADNPIVKLLPFEVAEAKQITLDSSVLGSWSLDASQEEKIVCQPLSAKSETMIYKAEKNSEDVCFFAVGCVGFGRVAVMAFDPAALSDTQRGETTGFWINRIGSVIGNSSDGSSSSALNNSVDYPVTMRQMSTFRSIVKAESVTEDEKKQNYGGRSYDIGFAQAGSNAIMEHLHNIVEMRPLSIGWVILILVLLAILLGPVDYIVLKRKGLLPLTWLTSTGWIILFTICAYYGVQALRGGRMQMRVVTVTDGIAGADTAWSTAHSGLFAPSSSNYKLDGLTEKQWFSGITPTAARVYDYNRSSATRNIYCAQHDGSNLPTSLPINIWTMQCLLTEEPMDNMPFAAEVSREGNNVVVSIENIADRPIKSGYVAFDDGMSVEFGRVEAGGRTEISDKIKKRGDSVQDLLSEYEQNNGNYNRRWDFSNSKAYLAQGILQRTIAIKDYLSHGAAVVYAEYEDHPTPFTVKDNSCDYDHIQLVRLVVFPDRLKEQIK